MMIDKNIQKNNYFEYRNVDPSMYEDSNVPAWIKREINSSELSILDYGCGFGQTINALRKEGFKNTYGVDIETTAINYCQKNNMNVKKLELDNLQNPFEKKFDIIILSHVLEHIPKQEIINTLSFIKREFLADKGKLLIAVPNAQSNTGSYWMYEDWTHTTLFTSGSLYYVLKAAGFENVEFLDIDCTLGSQSKIKIFLRRLFLRIYIANKNFWNKVTGSSYHRPSVQIFSYEIKCKAF